MEKYETPVMEIVDLEETDVICTSYCPEQTYEVG